MAPGWLAAVGLAPSQQWPWAMVAVLIVANAGFQFLLRQLTGKHPRKLVAATLWLQIVFDLFILTVVVHLVGTADTFIGFVYLFHIVLACIFFAPRHSFLVALLSAALYLGVVSLELIESSVSVKSTSPLVPLTSRRTTGLRTMP